MEFLEIVKSKHFIFPMIILFLLILIIVIQVMYYKKGKTENDEC